MAIRDIATNNSWIEQVLVTMFVNEMDLFVHIDN